MKKVLGLVAVLVLISGVCLFAGEGLRGTIFTSTTNQTVTVTNPFGTRVSLCYVSITGPLNSQPVTIKQTSNANSITNILSYYPTVSNTLSWVEGGKAIAWETGGKLIFQISATNVTAKNIIIQCKED